MQNKILILLFVIIGTFHFTELKAQKLKNLSIALTTETSSFPFTRFLPIHPGLEIGTSLIERSKQNSIHNVNVYIGGYHHQKIENAFYLRGEYAYRYKFKNTISLDAPVGIGYQHTFYPGEIYEQNATTGEWESINQIGKSHFLITFGLGLTYVKAKKFQPFIRYESNIDIPMYNGFLTTRTFFKLGINIKINQDESK